MGSDQGIRLHDIRAYEGSQNRAWEELAYQLRAAPGPGHLETRKTRAPDGGVEWYDTYDDDHEEGFQAKFNANLEAALDGMTESVKAVIKTRPRMTHLTFIVPYDFTDTGVGRRKSDQDRWNDKVASWKKNLNANLDFRVIRGGNILERLTLAEHAGRRAYWFNQLELTNDWLTRRWQEARESAGDRYTPDADTPSPVNALLDATTCSRAFLQQLHALAQRALHAWRNVNGAWGPEPVGELLARLEAWQQTVAPRRDRDPNPQVAVSNPDFAILEEIGRALSGMAIRSIGSADEVAMLRLQDAQHASDALTMRARSKLAQACTGRVAAITGPMGQGKTHALLRCAENLLHDDVPAVVVLSDQALSGTWWTAMSSVLDGIGTSYDVFLGALDAMAEARGCRAVLIVDALNESQDPYSWRQQLPALIAAVGHHPRVALLVSFRDDYRDVVLSPNARQDLLPVFVHQGIAGHEHEALHRYCQLFEVPVPAESVLDAAFSNSLFLRMYCEVLAAEPGAMTEPPTRSTLFTRFAEIRLGHARDRLRLSPTSDLPQQALDHVADLLIANDGRPIPRRDAEAAVEALLPSRTHPDTLFQNLVSAGVLELRPALATSGELVGLSFQAYSEHLLATRVLNLTETAHQVEEHSAEDTTQGEEHSAVLQALATRLDQESWLWRPMAVLLPERYQTELIDLIPEHDGALLAYMTCASLTERATAVFTSRTLQLLDACLTLDELGETGKLEILLTLAPRQNHPANADWLHQRLISMTMPDRDAWWSTITVDIQDTSAYPRLEGWIRDGLSSATPPEQVRLVGLALMWLLTSSNRFLRDHTTKLLTLLLHQSLDIASHLLEVARDVDDPYVQERMLTCAYGAVMTGGDADLSGVQQVCNALSRWRIGGLPIHVLARDAARGTMAWAYDRGLVSHDDLQRFDPPYGAAPPDEPPTADELRRQHDDLTDASGKVTRSRAYAILSSCLDWMGDFNKYVIASDVRTFSLYPLTGPAPTQHHQDPLGAVDANWAGRWVAHRALELGWTAERFDDFESTRDLRSGRDAHKVERIGKKYQWIALHELLARLADNYHPAHESWHTETISYQGPWPWFGRDIDPTLPPSHGTEGSRVCRLNQPLTPQTWLPQPDLENPSSPDEWVRVEADLPASEQLFLPQDETGRQWVALHRYATWHRDYADGRVSPRRVRDIFFLQFSWLVPRGQGQKLADVLRQETMHGRWMDPLNGHRERRQYLGETGWAPIEHARQPETYTPPQLDGSGLHNIRAAGEEWVWESSTQDCSLDESLNLNLPSVELLGEAKWKPHTATWTQNGNIVCVALGANYNVESDTGEEANGEFEEPDPQSVLLADIDWLRQRLDALDADLVLATLSERTAAPSTDTMEQAITYSNITYVALLPASGPPAMHGPQLTVRRTLTGDVDQTSNTL